MASEEGELAIFDVVSAQLIECAPDAATVAAVTIATIPPAVSPTQQAQENTISQTGADPPPAVMHG